MDFAVRKDARKFFDDIKGELDMEFDIFYFCFIAGVATLKKKDIPASETDALVDNYPGKYKSRGRLLLGLFLSRELDYFGVSIEQKPAVRTAIAKRIDPMAANHLTDAGAREFNKYAHGGFEVLLDWFPDRPRALHTFLRSFWKKVNEAMNAESGQKEE